MAVAANPSADLHPPSGGFALFDRAGRQLDGSPNFWNLLGMAPSRVAAGVTLANVLEVCGLSQRPSLPWARDIAPYRVRLRVQMLSAGAANTLVMITDLHDLVAPVADAPPSRADDMLTALVASLPAILFERRHFPDGRIEYAFMSEGGFRMLGMTPDVVAQQTAGEGQGAISVLHPDDVDLFLNVRDTPPNGMEVRRYSYRIVVPGSGTVHRMNAAALGRPTADGGAVWRGVTIEAPPLADAALIIGLEKLLDDLTRAVGPAGEDARHFVGAVATLIADMAGGGLAVNDHIARLTTEMKRLLGSQRQLSDRLTNASNELGAIRVAFEKARRDASFDPLTGLPNRRRLEEGVRHILDHPPSGPVALAVMDVDHFKRFNDSFGHIIGDEVLKLVGSVLRTEIPHGALAARYGGEEFVLLLPGMTPERAAEFCNQIRQHVAERDLVHKTTGEKLGRITLSAGIAPLVIADGFEIAFSRADAALYDAKKNGRNRVEIFGARH